MESFFIIPEAIDSSGCNPYPEEIRCLFNFDNAIPTIDEGGEVVPTMQSTSFW